MLCSNCGKDCGEFPFCPYCGTQVSQVEEAPASWSVETDCSECGGEELLPPWGKIEGVDGYVELWYHTLTICKLLHEQTLHREITLRDISNVVFSPADERNWGYFGVRLHGDLQEPVASVTDAAADETALIFQKDMNERFSQAYAYLKRRVVPKATPDIPKFCCPACGSERYYNNSRQFYRPHIHANSPVLALIYLGIGLYTMFAERGSRYVCQDCGHRWGVRR